MKPVNLAGIGLGLTGLFLLIACSEDAPVDMGTGGGAGTPSGGGAAGTAGSTAGGGMAGTAPGGSTSGGGGAGGAAGGTAGGGAGGTMGGGGAGGSGGAACDTKVGKAMKFAAAVDMVAGDLGNDVTFQNGPRTLELWAKFDGADSWKAEGSIIELGKPNGQPTNNKVWGIDMSGHNGTDGVFGPYVNGVSDNNGLDAPPKLVNTPVNVGWLHLAWAYEGNGGKLQFTVNGKQLPVQDPGANVMLGTSPGYVLLGASQNFGNGGWVGTMDEVRIWKIHKTPAQIEAGMKQIAKTTDPDLVAYYQFTEGMGGDVGDSTGKATHKLSACTAAGGACPAANAAMPTWVDSDIPGPFTCAP
jgi:hypothetical protein